MERLLLSRHAESVYNVEGLINADPLSGVSPLTERGREQAAMLGHELAEVPVELCVTSEFLRTISTGEIALGDLDVPQVQLSLLNDPPAGSFEGGPVSTFGQWMKTNGIHRLVPGTNTTIAGSARRFLDAARQVLGLRQKTVLVVAHGPVLRWFDQVAHDAAGSLDYDTRTSPTRPRSSYQWLS